MKPSAPIIVTNVLAWRYVNTEKSEEKQVLFKHLLKTLKNCKDHKIYLIETEVNSYLVDNYDDLVSVLGAIQANVES